METGNIKEKVQEIVKRVKKKRAFLYCIMIKKTEETADSFVTPSSTQMVTTHTAYGVVSVISCTAYKVTTKFFIFVALKLVKKNYLPYIVCSDILYDEN